jgi:hypothetical protein
VYRKRLIGALLLAFLAGVLWLGWHAFRAASDFRLALADLDRIQALSADPALETLPSLEADLGALEAHLTATQAAARPFLWLAPRLGWLPGIGADLKATPALLQIGSDLAGAGQEALGALIPVTGKLGARDQEQWLSSSVSTLAAAAPELAAADTRLAGVQAMRAALRTPLHPQLAAQLDRLDGLLPLARAGLQAAQAVPALAGADGPRTYLILAQNNDELRATGGFISAAGTIRLEGGRITDLKLSDSYAVDNWQQPHPAPPPALAEQMGAQLLVLRDSNWWPDFPSSAEIARALYQQDQGVATDGAIALDLETVRLLLTALGPLDVPDIAGPVTADGFMTQLKRAWEAPATSQGTIQDANTSDWWLKRKDFMGELLGAALKKLQSGEDLNPIALGSALLAMLEERHLQIAVDDPALASMLAERDWDGGLRPPQQGDFLAIVDSNVGFNKANAAMKQEIAYRVEPISDHLEATLTLTYTHTAPQLPSDELCDHVPRYGDSYDDLIRRCYWDYLRVYVPRGSELLMTDGLTRVNSESGEQGTTGFAGDFVLRPAAQHVVALRYRLPVGLEVMPYSLTVRKQAGTAAYPLRIEAGKCRFETTLDRDRRIECPSMQP